MGVAVVRHAIRNPRRVLDGSEREEKRPAPWAMALVWFLVCFTSAALMVWLAWWLVQVFSV